MKSAKWIETKLPVFLRKIRVAQGRQVALFLSPVLCLLSHSSPANADFNDIALESKGSVVEGRAAEAANAACSNPSVSSDGRYVVFSSAASNLVVQSDSALLEGIFLRDRVQGSTTRISVSSGGTLANAASSTPSISADGSLVVYESDATTLSPNTDSNGVRDVFAYSRAGDVVKTEVISSTVDGVFGNAASKAPATTADGSIVVFESEATNLTTLPDTNNASDILIKNRATGAVVRVSESASALLGNAASKAPVISGDGNLVGFESEASNLLIQTDVNQASDVFLKNLSTGEVSLISQSSAAIAGNAASKSLSMSSDGGVLAYASLSSNLVDQRDTNAKSDIFLYRRSSGTTTRISNNTAGDQANGESVAPFVSPDGSKVYFLSDATDLVLGDQNNLAGDRSYDVFEYTIAGAVLRRVSLDFFKVEQIGSSRKVAASNLGNLIVFDSTAQLTSEIISSRQIYSIDASCSGDSDGDGSVNCSDECPLDAVKVAAGSCGCGISESDSDSDGSADCVDACPADASKVNAGTCGCGTADTDVNANDVVDCSEPKETTVPKRPIVNVFSKNRLEIAIPTQFQKVSYQVRILKGSRLLRKIRTSSPLLRIRFSGRGEFSVDYRILQGEVSVPG